MSEIRAFFRYCPSCGKRFSIQLIDKKIVQIDRKSEVAEKPVAGVEDQVSGFVAPVPILLEEDRPVTVDIEEYEYTYKCKHCGHQWSELKVREEKVKA